MAREAFAVLVFVLLQGCATRDARDPEFLQRPNPGGGIYFEASLPPQVAADFLVERARRACPDGFTFTAGPAPTAGSQTTYAIAECHSSIGRDGLLRFCFDTLDDEGLVTSVTCAASEDGCGHLRISQPPLVWYRGCAMTMATGAAERPVEPTGLAGAAPNPSPEPEPEPEPEPPGDAASCYERLNGGLACFPTEGECNTARAGAGPDAYHLPPMCEDAIDPISWTTAPASDGDRRGCRCGDSWIDCSKNCNVTSRPPVANPRDRPRSCSKGCPCGNSCISCSKTCRK